MEKLDTEKTVKILNTILEQELAGVVRYTHYALMVTGPNRLPIVEFMKAQASESLDHAQQVGEILTGLGGHPSLSVAPLKETFQHSLKAILQESVNHEKNAVKLYIELLEAVEDSSIYLEEFARTMVGQEELHQMELKKMLRDLQRGVRHRLAISAFRRCPWFEAFSTCGRSGSRGRGLHTNSSINQLADRVVSKNTNILKTHATGRIRGRFCIAVGYIRF